MIWRTLIIVAALLVASCATKEQLAIGNVVHAGGLGNKGTPVYRGDISRQYTVIKPVYEKRRQIAGPNYYDHISGAAWMSHAGSQVGADAVIKYESNRIPGEIPLFDPGWFEAKGVAVKFKN